MNCYLFLIMIPSLQQYELSNFVCSSQTDLQFQLKLNRHIILFQTIQVFEFFGANLAKNYYELTIFLLRIIHENVLSMSELTRF